RGELYARAMPPPDLAGYMRAGTWAEKAGFVLPKLHGSWPAGGIVWLGSIQGETVRRHIGAGQAPEPDVLLDPLERLWATPLEPETDGGLDVAVDFDYSILLLSPFVTGDGRATP